MLEFGVGVARAVVVLACDWRGGVARGCALSRLATYCTEQEAGDYMLVVAAVQRAAVKLLSLSCLEPRANID